MIYAVEITGTFRHTVQVEADSEEQAVERAHELELTSESYEDGDVEYGDVWESDKFWKKAKTHDEGWEYVA